MRADRNQAQAPPEPPAGTVVHDFRTFFREKFELMSRMGVAFGACRDEAQEAAQQILTALYNRWRNGRWPDATDAYLRTAMHNELRKQWKRDQKRILALISKSEFKQESETWTGLQQYECEEWMRQHLPTLRPAQQTVMTLFYQGASYQEIATKLGKTEAAVRQSACAARRRLQARMKQEIADAAGATTPGTAEQARKENR